MEANEILFQGILSQDEDAVTAITVGLQSAPAESMRAIAEQFAWLPLLGSGAGTTIFKKNSFLNVLLRMLQFRIAAENTPDELDALCTKIDEEILDVKGEASDQLRIMWLTTAVIHFQANIRANLLIGYWIELIELLPKTSDSEKIISGYENDDSHHSEMGGKNYRSRLLLMILARKMDSVALLSLARAINSYSPELQIRVITVLKDLIFPLRLAVDRAWFIELEKTEQDWELVLTNLETFRKEVFDWGIPELQAFVSRAMAAIEDEHRNNSLKASEILQSSGPNGNQDHLIKDQLALVFLRAKKFPEALKIWQEIIPNWPVSRGSSDLVPLYACERAGKAAAQIPDWQAAIAFFQHGQHLANELDMPVFAISYLADEALMSWKSGKKIEALGLLVKAFEDVEKLSVSKTDEDQLHRTKKAMEQVVKWCRFDTGVSDGPIVWEPPAGLCSQIDINEKLKEIPAAPSDLMWFYLADIEMHIGEPGKVLDRATQCIKASKYAAVRCFVEKLKLTAIFRKRDFDSLIEILHDLNQAFSDSKANALIGKPVLDPDIFPQVPTTMLNVDLLEHAIIGVLVVLIENTSSLDAAIGVWKKASVILPNQLAVHELFTSLDIILALEGRDLVKIYHDDNALPFARTAAVVRLSSALDMSLDTMFVAQASLLTHLLKSSVREEVANSFGKLVRIGWQRRAHFPAEFLTPRLTIPAILSACSDASHGLQLAARILLQVQHAVRVKIPSTVIETWRQLADG